VPDEARWDIGAAALVVQDGRVLMVRHTYGVAKGLWVLPGGRARHDERLDQTALRELREETGIEGQIVDVAGLRTRVTERSGAVFVLFRVRPMAGQAALDQAVPDGREVDRVAWFSAAEIEALPDDAVFAPARHAALAALSDRRGLREDEGFPFRDASYHAYVP
jgi:8-oxo-dGTP pyrophosphatase MutT (NUDIX family)